MTDEELLHREYEKLLRERIEELEADLRKMALDYLAAEGQAAEAYQAQLAAEDKLATCEKYKAAYAECDRIGTQTVRDLEAKLEKAAEALDWIGYHMVMSMALDQGHLCRMMKQHARTTLAELKGEADD
jgi:hypothetical protein